MSDYEPNLHSKIHLTKKHLTKFILTNCPSSFTNSLKWVTLTQIERQR
uniref:Uncharacterized protein n=1 Tax=Anguilla anguilla TaxID=7936 RepID=A0A0E9UMA1_ANGAN